MKILITIILLTYNAFSQNYGELLFSGNCVTCHHKTENISAPSVNEIRKHYLNAFPNEKDFVKFMSEWVLKPDATTSIMQHSIKKYKLMPELAYEKYTLEEIAKYIYKTDFNMQQKLEHKSLD